MENKQKSSFIETFIKQVNRKSRDASKLNPHSDQFCVDISSYGPVEWVEEEAEECATEFVKKCEDKTENVCADVVETKCEVVPYTECTMGVVMIDYTESVLVPRQFTPKECVTKRETIPHHKMVPECRNVTKRNCVTLWETDENGKQVWAGNEACEPVTWQECKLVQKDVNFIVPKVECNDTESIWFYVPDPETKTRETNTMTCEVKSTTSCESQTREDCTSITYQECAYEPVPSCKESHIHKPTQEQIHRKKCLLPDLPPPVTEAPDDYGAPAAPVVEQPSYNPEVPSPEDVVSLREGRQLRQGRKFVSTPVGGLRRANS